MALTEFIFNNIKALGYRYWPKYFHPPRPADECDYCTCSSADCGPTISPPKNMANYITSFKAKRDEQTRSALFNDLPGEIRDKIFEYALSPYDDAARTYGKDTPYRRPTHLSAQLVDAELLQTCQRVYREAWFRPWITANHTFYLAWEGRRPEEVTTPAKFQPILDMLYALHGKVVLEHLRIFAQLCYLEPGLRLNSILTLEHFHPRTMTITVRHTDWWNWELDGRLHIAAGWVAKCRFPASLEEFRLELESLQRKKGQIDYLANQMVKYWQLETTDGTKLCANEEDFKTETWKGSSTWENERWIRDETAPETVEYYIKTVVFRPVKNMPARPEIPNLFAPSSFEEIQSSRPKLLVFYLKAAGVLPGTTADQALAQVNKYLEPPTDNNEDNEEHSIINDNENYDYDDEDEIDEYYETQTEPAADDVAHIDRA